MKTRKVLALVVLAAMVLSLMPAMAFGAPLPGPLEISVPFSSVAVPSSSASAQDKTDPDGDGAEFTLTIVLDGDPDGTPTVNKVWAASSRYSVDEFFYKNKDGEWKPIPKDSYSNAVLTLNSELAQRGAATNVYEATIKVVSRAAGTSQIVFGICDDCVANYARGRSIPYDSHTSSHSVATQIIDARRFPVEFTAPKANKITLQLAPIVGNKDGDKAANNIDSYTLWAYVYTGDDSNIPVNGARVNFSIVNGPGANLSAATATTNAAGRAEIKVYSNRPGPVTVQANVTGAFLPSSETTNRETVTFKPTGVVSIKAEDRDDQKVARDFDYLYKGFAISAYDTNGNRLELHEIGLPSDNFNVDGRSSEKAQPIMDLTVDVLTKPSGSALLPRDIEFKTNSVTGNLDLSIPYGKLNRDGLYEIRAYLVNGVSITYKFNVKDLGDIVKMGLSYGSSSYAAGTVLPEPSIYYEDADEYQLRRAWHIANEIGGNDISLSISDASFMDSELYLYRGQFKLNAQKSGAITMSAIDRNKNLVATAILNIEKSASYLKLTPTGVGPVGGEVRVDVQLVDIDGKNVSTALGIASAKAAVIGFPAGAVASVSNPYTGDFGRNGSSFVRVSSNMEGDVVIQVIITEVTRILPWVEDELTYENKPFDPTDDKRKPLASDPIYDDTDPLYLPTRSYQADYDAWFKSIASVNKVGGRTYTGPWTVPFGSVSAGGGTLIFIIGAPTFVGGSTPYAAESPAFIENGRTFLGFRDIGTAIGATVEWDPDTNTATMTKDNITVKATVGAEVIVVTKNGVTTEIAIDAPAQNKAGRVYLPFRAILQDAFGYTVNWEEATQSIVCTI